MNENLAIKSQNTYIIFISILFTTISFLDAYNFFHSLFLTTLLLFHYLYAFSKAIKHIQSFSNGARSNYKYHTDLSFIIFIIGIIFYIISVLKFMVYFLGSTGIIKT